MHVVAMHYKIWAHVAIHLRTMPQAVHMFYVWCCIPRFIRAPAQLLLLAYESGCALYEQTVRACKLQAVDGGRV